MSTNDPKPTLMDEKEVREKLEFLSLKKQGRLVSFDIFVALNYDVNNEKASNPW